MREIKFRGQSIDSKEWIYGDILQVPTKGWYSIMQHTVSAFNFPIIPETVGQFTGLLDKNGKDGYEYDIVKVNWLADLGITELDLEANGIIKYHVESASFRIELIKPISMGVCEDGIYEEKWLPLLKHEEDMNYEWEIVGNIHDNPELLK